MQGSACLCACPACVLGCRYLAPVAPDPEEAEAEDAVDLLLTSLEVELVHKLGDRVGQLAGNAWQLNDLPVPKVGLLRLCCLHSSVSGPLACWWGWWYGFVMVRGASCFFVCCCVLFG